MMADTMFAKISSMVICLQNDYADVLQKNGYTYTGADGKTYNSGAYSIVHDK
ncbi:hemagglutinin, partial [Neisseria meningitidis]|nr:hemagglutinin [Neisseria meningitidis]MBG8678555.1 hemagglutinin [Neisseria meningitidis]